MTPGDAAAEDQREFVGLTDGAIGVEEPCLRASTAARRRKMDLLVWRKAHELVLAVYSFTATFPKEERYGLVLQIRRAAVSVPANIAEGFRRRGKADKARYMNMAEASLEESRYYLILAHDLGYG
jgi:four helix bundle protein